MLVRTILRQLCSWKMPEQRKEAKARLFLRGAMRTLTYFMNKLNAKKKTSVFPGDMVMCAVSMHTILNVKGERMDRRFHLEQAIEYFWQMFQVSSTSITFW